MNQKYQINTTKFTNIYVIFIEITINLEVIFKNRSKVYSFLEIIVIEINNNNNNNKKNKKNIISK